MLMPIHSPSICDVKSIFFFLASVFVMKEVRRFPVFCRLNKTEDTEDEKAIAIKDHLLCSSVILPFYGGHNLTGLFLCILMDFDNNKIFLIGANINEAAIKIIGHAEGFSSLSRDY
jgi:hypothetical protein